MRRTRLQDDVLGDALDWEFLEAAVEAASQGRMYLHEGPISNVNRTVGTLTGSEITRRGIRLEADNLVRLSFDGSAGQSLGAFMPKGMTINLRGDANDYVGKGLSGGRIVIYPDELSTFASEKNVIAGNVIGYGATSGEIFLRGVVGERLAVRNSGATIVVEGAGDHAAEYMTGGVLVILGPTGRNTCAGMSGGSAYFYDPESLLSENLAAGEFDLDLLDAEADALVKDLLTRFVAETQSQVAARILENWPSERMNFIRVESVEYRRAREKNNG
jgi:glutamate synthase (NADPH/NADH) large chain